jgi:hypothetical protein
MPRRVTGQPGRGSVWRESLVELRASWEVINMNTKTLNAQRYDRSQTPADAADNSGVHCSFGECLPKR